MKRIPVFLAMQVNGSVMKVLLTLYFPKLILLLAISTLLSACATVSKSPFSTSQIIKKSVSISEKDSLAYIQAVADLEKGLKTNQFLLDRFSGRFDAQDSMMGLLINGELTEENFRRNRILNDLMGNSTQYAWLQDENIITILQKEHALLSENKLGNIKTLLSAEAIQQFQVLVKQVIVEPNLLEYIAKLVVNTRENGFLYLGASPRASIAILNAAKGFAALRGRDFVTPEDIKEAAIPVLQHRVIVTPEREMEGITSKEIIQQIIESIEIPR